MATIIPAEPEAFFNEFVPAQFENNPQVYPRTPAPGAAVVHVVGKGTWNFRVENSKLVIGTGVPADTFLQIALSSEDFLAMYVARAQREIDDYGDLSADSKMVFRPLFPTDERWEIVRANRGTIAVRLEQAEPEDRAFTLVLTPGADTPSEPRASVRMRMEDFLGLSAGRLKATALLVDGRLKVKGDLAHALKLNSLFL